MTEREQELRACLEKLGWDESEVWVAREPDYVELIGATPEDIPFLVGVMKEWLDDREWDDDDEALWAPLHAWRTLAHLGDISAMDDLLAMLVPSDERDPTSWLKSSLRYSVSWELLHCPGCGNT